LLIDKLTKKRYINRDTSNSRKKTKIKLKPLKKEALSSTSSSIKLLLKKTKKIPFNFFAFNPFKIKIQANKITKSMVIQLLGCIIFSIASSFFYGKINTKLVIK